MQLTRLCNPIPEMNSFHSTFRNEGMDNRNSFWRPGVVSLKLLVTCWLKLRRCVMLSFKSREKFHTSSTPWILQLIHFSTLILIGPFFSPITKFTAVHSKTCCLSKKTRTVGHLCHGHAAETQRTLVTWKLYDETIEGVLDAKSSMWRRNQEWWWSWTSWPSKCDFCSEWSS